jgi:hypothetical protein
MAPKPSQNGSGKAKIMPFPPGRQKFSIGILVPVQAVCLGRPHELNHNASGLMLTEIVPRERISFHANLSRKTAPQLALSGEEAGVE